MIRRILVIFIKIVIVVSFIVTLNRIFMPKYINENQDGRITGEYYREEGKSDVIFVGSSTVYSGVSPIQLFKDYGITSYDRSNASQTTWISYYMIEDAIKYNKPRLVCFDVSFSRNDDNYVEEASTRKALDGMRFGISKINCINEAMGEDEKLIEYLFPLFRFHSRWKELSIDDIKNAYYYDPVTYNGFIMNDGIEPAANSELVYLENENAVLGARNASYLKKIIELCKTNDVEIMFFKTPNFSGNWSYGYDKEIGEICKDYGVNYVNFDSLYEQIGIDYSMHSFDGGSHLNTDGAEIFTRYLGNYIKSNYDVPSHLEENAYLEIWNDKIKRYEEARESGI